MSFFVSLFVWFLMAAVLIVGVILAVKGSFWLLILGLLAFIAAITKIGIFGH